MLILKRNSNMAITDLEMLINITDEGHISRGSLIIIEMGAGGIGLLH